MKTYSIVPDYKYMHSPPSHKVVGPTINLISETYYSCEENYTFIYNHELPNNHLKDINDLMGIRIFRNIQNISLLNRRTISISSSDQLIIY